MKNKILLLLIVISSTFCVDSYAQQEAQYTQYMYNTLSFNPAYAGQRDVLSIVGLHRSQWVGLDGAPRTQTLTLHSPIGESEKVGLGLSIVNDQIGPTHETNFDLAFSYKLQLSDENFLSLGLKAGGHLLDVGLTELNAQTNGDVLLQEDINNRFSPNFGAGLFFRHADTWYLGLSIPNFLETKHFDSSTLSEAKERMHIYLMGGYVFDFGESVKFKPAALIKAVKGAPLQADITGNFLFFDKLTLGAAYRWDAAFSGLAGFQISDELMIGLAYDRETTDLGNTQFNDGSYELFLRYELLNNKKGRLLSPRFF